MKKELLRLAVMLVIVLSGTAINAQYFIPKNGPCPRGKSIGIDTVSFTPASPLPFDRCFSLKYVLKGHPNIQGFTVMPVDRDGKFSPRKRDWHAYHKSHKGIKKKSEYLFDWEDFQKHQPEVLFDESHQAFKKAKNTNLIVDIPPLDPGREYRITLLELDLQESTLLYKAGKLIHQSNMLQDEDESVKKIDEAKKVYEEYKEHHEKIAYAQTKEFEDFRKFICGKIATSYKKIESWEASLKALSAEDCFKETDLYRKLMKRAVACPCKSAGIKDLTEKDELTFTLATLNLNKKNLLNKAILGLVKLTDPEYKEEKASAFTAQLGNLKKNKEVLLKLKGFSSRTALLDTLDVNGFIGCTDKLLKKINKSEELIKKLSKEVDSLKVKLSKEVVAYKVIKAPSLASTTSLDFQTRAKLRIVPDFGLIGVLRGGSRMAFSDLTPYLGFHVNMRPIDKNIPMKMVRYKSFWHRMSVLVGMTLTSLEIENQREDLFKNSSLVTGIGVRLNNYVRVTGGQVWFESISTNPVSGRKPLKSSAFIGVALDLELQDLFGGINRLFK